MTEVEISATKTATFEFLEGQSDDIKDEYQEMTVTFENPNEEQKKSLYWDMFQHNYILARFCIGVLSYASLVYKLIKNL